MSEGAPPDVPVMPRRRSFWRRVSVVWLVPLAALVIALAVAWQSYADRGPLILITFGNAAGVHANETELRYRDVPVGIVEEVSFTPSLDKVEVAVRLDKDVAPFVDEGAEFWVVRPEVSAQGVTGLNTVLSGVFIEGIWDTEPGGVQTYHEGADEAPLNREGRAGLLLRLRAASDVGLTERATITFRGIEVGRIGRAAVSDDGSTVEADAIIFEPHDRLITTATRFWDTSGFTFSLGPNGAEIDFASLASLVTGGVTFQTVMSGGDPVSDGTVFNVFADEGSARSSLFGEGEGESLILTAVFTENVAGLAVDAPVDLGGLRIGRVNALNGVVDEERFGDRRVRLAATLEIRPARLGLENDVSPEEALAYLQRRVDEGLRARLTTASLLTGGLKVEFVQVDDAPPAAIDMSGDPNPVVPTTESDIADVSATAEGVFERINALPIEEVLQSAIGMMDNVSLLVGSEDVRAVPGEARALLGEARETVGGVREIVGSDELQALPARLGEVVGEIEALIARINTQDVAGRLLAAVDEVAEAADAVTGAVEGVPELVARIDAVAAKAESLPLEDLAEEATRLVQSADAILASEAAQTLPADLSAALEQVRGLVQELREGGLIENANATFASARAAADSINDAAEDLPALLRRAQAVLDRAAVTIRGYDAQEGVGRDIAATLREVERAADAVSSLARALERNPNSLLFGR